MAGLHSPLPADRLRTGASCEGTEGNALLRDPWAFHFVQLLYFHHDLPVSGALFHRTSYFGRTGTGKKIRGELREVWNLLSAFRRTRGGSSAAGDLCAPEHGIWQL